MNADFSPPAGRAALDPQLDLCRDRRECATWEPAPRFLPTPSVPAPVALLASVLACLFSINR